MTRRQINIWVDGFEGRGRPKKKWMDFAVWAFIHKMYSSCVCLDGVGGFVLFTACWAGLLVFASGNATLADRGKCMNEFLSRKISVKSKGEVVCERYTTLNFYRSDTNVPA